ncbi:MAG: NAD(P)(+) transhydrogenase (Re/Si-specific) subunit alpha, partial [Thermoleophilia bacterium]|nr:NAD(P)(+) transhydrogenase (Re/Si-specific) subunit alpha [Thermoleophilia bacterium]
MTISLLRETSADERRVALTPDIAKRLVDAGHKLHVEHGAGDGAGWPDTSYTDAGAVIFPDAESTVAGADVVVKVNAPRDLGGGNHEADLLPDRSVLISMLNPLGDEQGITYLATNGVSAYAMELIPRISRAQSMDVLSSMATVTGYRAMLIAAERLDKFFPMLMTAAGTVAPAKVFVIGAGVAGLQAIATARRLGAVVTAYDPRAAVAEQVQSLGAKFVDFKVTDDAEAA